MRPKPAHLGPQYGAQFQDEAVVAAYHHRPPYPDAVFPLLNDLLGNGPGVVLDVGCGTGDIARRLAPLVERLDAVDVSAPMIARGRTLPGGDDPRLRWILGAVEDAPLHPPYGLITAGECLHWMEWEVVLPRFRALLAPGGVLALIGRGALPAPWGDAMPALLSRFSTNREFQPYDLVTELTTRGLFTVHGACVTLPEAVTQTVAGYVESFHSRNGFSRDRMTPENAAAFDAQLAELVRPWAMDGRLMHRHVAEITWGMPESAPGPA
jgi:SAM-dependent methyltransferase